MTQRRVLLVDDDADTRELFSFVLKRAGADVTVAMDGLSALEAASRTHPDLVITDIAMPRMDGVTLTHRLRREALSSDVPIIAVTGQPIGHVSDEAREAGCTEVVSKPCPPATLIAIVNHHIGRRDEDHGTPSHHFRQSEDRRTPMEW